MSISLPIPVNEVICKCVCAVSYRILSQLQEADSNIRALTFMYGHPLELKGKLKEMTEDKDTRYLKFPVIMLFADVVKSPSSVKGSYHDVTLNMVIAMSTQPEYDTAKREITNFQPILRPIYTEFIQQIARCGYFWVQSPRQILGRDIERFYWGKESIQGNSANEFNDYIDAIEIKNLKLTQSKKGSTITQNTFTQMVEYFLSQTRAMITVGAVADNTITNSFFLNPITSILLNEQGYVVGVDFTQPLDGNSKPTGSIIGINIEFKTGQTLKAER